MITRSLTSLTLVLHLTAAEVVIRHSPSDQSFKIDPVPGPIVNDAASDATFRLIDGRQDPSGADISVLNDGQVPFHQDDPKKNFFFAPGTSGGRIGIDLGDTFAIKSVNTYSWHPTERGPQVYLLYAATGEADGFQESPKAGIDPEPCGWTPIAKVDTRTHGQGGQHTVSVSGSKAEQFGTYRHLLFDIRVADPTNPLSNTFFSEIDVIVVDAPPAVPVPGPVITTYKTPDGMYSFTIDTTEAPGLRTWIEDELLPVIQEWYPRLVELLPSEGYKAPAHVEFFFPAKIRDGIPAYAHRNRVTVNAEWLSGQLQGEGKGCIVHEMVHIVQNYGIAGSINPNPTPTPGWVTEGIADYVRWFIFEKGSRGARITRGNFPRCRYDASYRITANFFDWVTRTYDQDFVRKLNAAAREGRYSAAVWKESTGKSVEELGEEWKAAHAKRLGL